MDSFEKAYKGLNDLQREAVETLEGPVLVIAGPGTGKTQLISTRVGHILKNTDTPPGSILALTFTEAGAKAMRERLTKFIGQAAYEINISTYHAFGSELVRRYPEYFEQGGLEPLDDLTAYVILSEIVARLPYSNPLKYADNYLGDVLRFISDAKRALLRPQDIEHVAKINLVTIQALNKGASSTLKSLTTVSKKTVPLFEKIYQVLADFKPATEIPDAVLPLSIYAANDLELALESFATNGKTTALTEWKRVYLAKDEDGNFVFAGRQVNEKLIAAAGVYQKYQDQLAERRLYDYDDMILRAIEALEKNPEFKYSLADQYLYIHLDEFQDTNPAQMRLIELLTDHPVLEGRPNILAVGDDDQAIYAFQGADHANMAAFARYYNDVKIISLEENYRSHHDILQTAQNISGQISDRLVKTFKGIEKKLIAANKDLPLKAIIRATEFKSDAAQYEWVAGEIKRLIDKDKVEASEIAILAPQHRYLVPLLTYLARAKVPVRYERRENILDSPLVRQIEQMGRLTIALGQDNYSLADSLWPEIISYDFWGLKTEEIWQVSWQASQSQEPWAHTLLSHVRTKQIAVFFLRLKDILPVSTLEQQIDILVGLPEISAQFEMPNTSPLFEYYFGDQKAQNEPVKFTALLSSLNVLRDHLRRWRGNQARPLGLEDLTAFIDAHRTAGINILDTHAYNESEEAVNILTAYGAKGREFKAVFLLAAQDEVWGSASRGRGTFLSLPVNVRYIRYQGASEDERLRLLYVALTRAKTNLYITSYAKSLAGRAAARLKYLDIREDEDGKLRSHMLPAGHDIVLKDEQVSIDLAAVEDYWASRHEPPFKPELKALLEPRLQRYQLSATDVNTFTNVASGGPQAFFIYSLLRFPHAQTIGASYGTAIHNTLHWYYQTANTGATPTLAQLLDQYENSLVRQRLALLEHGLFMERGSVALTAWYSQRGQAITSNEKYEYSFRNEASFVGDAHLTGIIDRLIIDSKSKTVTIIDFKSGQAYHRWANNNIRLHQYRQQLLIYKLLVEDSRSFKGYTVEKGILEFIEPDETGKIIQLELPYDDNELNHMKALLTAVWRNIQALNLPDVTGYSATPKGITDFENYLIDKE